MRSLLISVTLFAVCSVYAASPVAGGYQEAVFSVSDPAEWQDFFEQIGGWELVHDGPVDDRLLEAWQLPATASAREIVLANPGTKRGFVRLLHFRGVEQVQIRSNAQTWDVGGMFDVNSRILSMDKKFSELQARDWQSVSEPVEFSFGPFVVREWLARGPDGIVLALIERVEPPLAGHPQLRELGRLINATQIVDDIDAAREFWIDKLGFRSYLEHSGPSKQAGPNVLGLPYNLAAEVTRHVSIVHPDAINEGSIELLEFEGLRGADYSARAKPPNLGILTLRFPVVDITVFAEHVKQQGIEITVAPKVVDMPPYGTVHMMAIRGPAGVWLEFYAGADQKRK